MPQVRGCYASTSSRAAEFERMADGPGAAHVDVEVARCYHTVLVSRIPVMDASRLHEMQGREYLARPHQP